MEPEGAVRQNILRFQARFSRQHLRGIYDERGLKGFRAPQLGYARSYCKKAPVRMTEILLQHSLFR